MRKIVSSLVVMFFCLNYVSQSSMVGEIYFSHNNIDTVILNEKITKIRIIYTDFGTESSVNQDFVFNLLSKNKQIKSVEFIDFPFSKFSEIFYKMNGIENLYLQNSNLDSICFDKFKLLKKIAFSRCYDLDFRFTLSQLSNNNNEIELSFNSCRIGLIPEEINLIPKLKNLAISNNMSSLIVDKKFFKLKNIKTFSFGGTKIYVENSRSDILNNYSPGFFIFN